MLVLLAFLFFALGLGLRSDRIGGRESALLLAGAVLVTGLYFAFPRLI